MNSSNPEPSVTKILLATLLGLLGCANPLRMTTDATDNELAMRYIASHHCNFLPEESGKYEDGNGEFRAYECEGEDHMRFIEYGVDYEKF